MKISSYFRPERICLQLPPSGKTAALRAVAEQLRSDSGIKDFESFFNEIVERERISNTALGHEVALPHARTDQVNDIVVAVGCCPEGVDFDAHDHKPVKFIILIGTPKKMVTEYLRIVGALARLMKQDSFREGLLQCKTPQEFIELFRQSEGD
jgi:mannitol/fructose-specific phosphotransferase system IIA component (Ntr-type)